MVFLFFVLYLFVNWIDAISRFGTAHAVGVWYFAPCDHVTGLRVALRKWHWDLTLQGVTKGCWFHTGSLVFGATAVTATKLLGLVLCWVSSVPDLRQNSNAATRTLAACLECVDRFVHCMANY